MEKIKFVMTDTDPQVSALCRHVLEEKGVSVTICEKNGAKALETLLTIHPQAVLLDAFMPDLDAITVKQRYPFAPGEVKAAISCSRDTHVLRIAQNPDAGIFLLKVLGYLDTLV